MILNKPLSEEDFPLEETSKLEEDSEVKLDILEEMTVLRKSETGLPVNIWLDACKIYIREGCGKIIKFQGDYEHNTNRSNIFSMFLSKDNPEILPNQITKVKLPAKDIDKIKEFIKKNFNLLNKLADEKISNVMFFRQMGWLEEDISYKDELEEMSTLKKTMTNLPVNIWVDDTKAYIAGGHAKRIKFQGDYGNNTNRSNLFPMLLSKDDPQIPEKFKSKIKLPAKDIEAIKRFVKNNADLLDKLADEKIDIGVFIKRMKKVTVKEALEEDSDIELDILEEMSNLWKSETGLPVNIWLDINKTYIRGGHGKRIKFQNDYRNSTDGSNLLPMTISKDNPEIPEKYLPKVRLSSKDIEKIKTFVKNNAQLLNKLADRKISITMFANQMKV